MTVSCNLKHLPTALVAAIDMILQKFRHGREMEF